MALYTLQRFLCEHGPSKAQERLGRSVRSKLCTSGGRKRVGLAPETLDNPVGRPSRRFPLIREVMVTFHALLCYPLFAPWPGVLAPSSEPCLFRGSHQAASRPRRLDFWPARVSRSKIV